MTGILEHIEGRKLTVTLFQYEPGTGTSATIYLRKGVDSSQYLPLLQSEVEVTTVEEKGYQMVQEIKPALPKTAVEEIKGPVEMPPSANIPKLDFKAAQETFTVSQSPTVVVKDSRTQKDHDIMRQWAMGAVLNSKALSECNDAVALSTQQTVERAKKIAEELIKWVVNR